MNKNVIKFIKKNLLYFVIFFTGACVLVIEVIATRILAPFFGSTIYSVSSILGVILAALSIGYYYGGVLADKRPQKNYFFSLIAAAGISILLLEIINQSFLSVYAREFTIQTGPLVFSLVLFFAPAILLGMLSPYAIKIIKEENKKIGIGKVSGTVYFSSTVGSIFGSFLAGFYLIPNFGINNIMLFIGSALLVLGIVGYYYSSRNLQKVAKLFIVSVSLLLINLILANESHYKSVFENDGVYQKIVIFDGVYEKQKTRMLLQDANLSAAKQLDNDNLVFDYTKYFEIYKFFNPDIENALFVGGGAYSIPYALLNENEAVNIEVVEIEPELFQLAKKYFNYDDDLRLTNHANDGRMFLANSDKNYDLIFLDVYSSLYSIPVHFTTVEFFELVNEKLSNDGVVIINVIGALDKNNQSFLLSQVKTFIEVFKNYYLFAVDSPNTDKIQNFILVGYKSDMDIKIQDEKIGNEEIVLNNQLVDVSDEDLDNQMIFSDDYAPIEYLFHRRLVDIE